jgi:hypothetical protein
MMYIRRPGVILIVLAVAFLAACSRSTPVPHGEPELPATLPVVDMRTFTLPLAAYELTEDQMLAAYTARNMLIVRCLKRFGFTIVPPQAPPPSPGGPNERRYLIVSADRARLYGYKWPEITNLKRPVEPELPPGAEAALTGDGASQVGGVPVPKHGCMGEAETTLGAAQDEAGELLIRDLANDAYLAMQQDSRVVAATRRWGQCMLRSGFHYQDPAHANDDPAFATSVATPAEINTAVADVACKKESNIINIQAAVETALQNRAINNSQQQLQSHRRSLDQRIQFAADVFAGRK